MKYYLEWWYWNGKTYCLDSSDIMDTTDVKRAFNDKSISEDIPQVAIRDVLGERYAVKYILEGVIEVDWERALI